MHKKQATFYMNRLPVCIHHIQFRLIQASHDPGTGGEGERVHGHTDYQQQQFTPGSHIRLPDCHCHQGKASDRGVLVLKGNGHSGGGDTVPAFDGRKDRCGGPYTPP